MYPARNRTGTPRKGADNLPAKKPDRKIAYRNLAINLLREMANHSESLSGRIAASNVLHKHGLQVQFNWEMSDANRP